MGVDPIGSLDSTAKVKLLERLEKQARAKDPRVVQVMAGLASEYDVVMVARADGTLAADVRPLVRLSLSVIVEQNGRRESGSAGGGGRFGLAHFDADCLTSYVEEAVGSALTNLEARPAPAGEMTVVLGSGWPGILLHEAIGHGLEGDFNRKGSSAFSARLADDYIEAGHKIAKRKEFIYLADQLAQLNSVKVEGLKSPQVGAPPQDDASIKSLIQSALQSTNPATTF
jgi:TldD protein